MNVVNPSAVLLWITPEAEKMIEIAGRTCYKSEPKIFKDCKACKGFGTVSVGIPDLGGYISEIDVECEACSKRSTKEFIQKIITSGHDSVLEHSVVSFRVVCDRGVSHEFVRSRIGFSYSQESTRYCNYSSEKFGNSITFIRPSQLTSAEDTSDFHGACHNAEVAYNQLIQKGKSPQIARSVLPNCLKTEIAVTANIRAWRHFLKQRLSLKAHPDMKILAELIYRELIIHCPNCFFDITPTN